ncbi:MAG: hypothetical protein U0L05_09070 [Schaedlerella sp.]|nr:hypothetical protein [Schaedlerella sp.]
MDWVQGELLIYRIKDNPRIDRQQLFDWARQLLEQILSYHRCHAGQNYRYLNPYSVLVTKEEKLLLLDLTAESNEFVLRNLQKRAMRTHFVKPVIHITEGDGDFLDLYGYGKTLQFILANINTEPSLTKSQEKKFEKIINKCLNELPGKQYKELIQVEKDLPVIKEKKNWEDKKYIIFNFAAAMSIAIALSGWIFSYYLMKEQDYIKDWIWEVQQREEDSEQSVSDEIDQKIENVENELQTEIEFTQENIKAVSETIEQHINEVKEAQEETTDERADATAENEQTVKEPDNKEEEQTVQQTE